MNNKSKLVLGLSAMLAATVGVAATGTFAWFTTTRVAQVNVASMNVYSDFGSLAVSYADTQPTDQGAAFTTPTGAGTVASPLAIAGTFQATDISGDGEKFFKPDWLPGKEGSEASAISTITNSSTNRYYVTFNLTFKNAGNKAISVYFNIGTALAAATAGNTNDVAAQKSTRVAVWSTAETPVLASLWQQDADTTTGGAVYQYIANNTAGTAYTAQGTLTSLTAESGKFHVGAFSQVQKGFTAGAGQLLCTVAAKSGSTDGATTLRFAQWIEGTLNEADNDAIGGIVNSTFKFAALENA